MIILAIIVIINIKPIKVLWWAHTVEVEEIQKIEMICMPSLENEQYKLIDESFHENYINKLHKTSGIYSIHGRTLVGAVSTYYFTMKDGTRHKICCDGEKIWIDNMPFITVQTIRDEWAYEQGNQMIPENFDYMTAD